MRLRAVPTRVAGAEFPDCALAAARPDRGPALSDVFFVRSLLTRIRPTIVIPRHFIETISAIVINEHK